MKKNNITVSVFMMTYNHDKYISKAIDSILAQKVNFSYNIVIGDDCSEDNTQSIILSYSKIHNGKFKLLFHKENIGAGKNHISVMEACEGKYIAMLEGDDYWTDPLKLQKQVDFFEEHKYCNYVFTKKKRLKLDNKIYSEPDLFLPKVLTLSQLLKTKIFPFTGTVMFKSEALPNKYPSFFETAFNGDWVLMFLINQNSKIGFINEETAVYRENVGIIKTTNKIKQLKNGLKTAKSLDKYTNYKYHYYFKKRYYNYEKLSREYFLQRKLFMSIFYFFKRVVNSLLNKEKHSLRNSLNFLKHTLKRN